MSEQYTIAVKRNDCFQQSIERVNNSTPRESGTVQKRRSVTSQPIHNGYGRYPLKEGYNVGQNEGLNSIRTMEVSGAIKEPTFTEKLQQKYN